MVNEIQRMDIRLCPGVLAGSNPVIHPKRESLLFGYQWFDSIRALYLRALPMVGTPNAPFIRALIFSALAIPMEREPVS